MKRLLPILLLFSSMTLVAAENTGYRIVHPDGTVEFTDDATLGGEEIKLRDVQTVAVPDDEGAEERSRKQREVPPKKKSATVSYSNLSITSPRAEETIWSSGSGVRVAVSVNPALQPEHKIVVKLDGSERARAKSKTLNIGQVERGTHSVSAAVVDMHGATLISSSPVIFYLRQRGK